MSSTDLLDQSFYDRHAVSVARDLLGRRLVRRLNGQRVSGYIIECEAYYGEEDLACHARAGRTPRTAIMYGQPGRAYVYFTYGMHWLLNCVTGAEGFAAAVLLRAIWPQEGLEEIAARRPGVARARWCDGPAKLCRALQIDGQQNGASLLLAGGELWIEHGQPLPDEWVQTSPRIGIQSTPEPWRSIPWRFVAAPPPEFWTAA
ncbi:MAG: DNA-3-methyladenine glycosylase [Chloroflexi bacterium]|nr:DNA-3-methyladenine glycosylase [Chloroflexota bacterium]